jgi:hypothetical protein
VALGAPRGEVCPGPSIGCLGSLGVRRASVVACGFDKLGLGRASFGSLFLATCVVMTTVSDNITVVSGHRLGI